MSVEVGDRALVDTTCYGVPGEHWCPVIRLAVGEAAVYPIKVDVPGRGEGQYAPDEIIKIIKSTFGEDR